MADGKGRKAGTRRGQWETLRKTTFQGLIVRRSDILSFIAYIAMGSDSQALSLGFMMSVGYTSDLRM
jgi:hypothetical protein